MENNTLAHTKKMQALALVEEKRLTEARDLYAEICRVDPLDAEAWFRLGTIYLETCAMAQAEACFHQVIKLRPRLDIAYYNLARSLEFQGTIHGKYDDAIAVYRQLLQITHNIEAYFNIGVIYEKQGKIEEALKTYHEAQRIEPDNIRLVAAEARTYERRGDFDKAYALIRPPLEAGRETPELALVFASLSSRFNRRQQAIDLMERLLAKGDSFGNYNSEIYLRFALGKLLDATGDFDRAFDHFRKGNALIRHAFDLDDHLRFVEAVIRTFNKEFVRRAPRAKDRSAHLIFIIGMPRSGTTLIEQILDSHPRVYGCGELPDIVNMAHSMPELLGTKERYPHCVVSLDQESCNMLAQRYNLHVNELSGGADFAADKMPQNFNHLGLIALLFPDAKIIHCVRDPLDTCLSCYFQNFGSPNTGMGYTTDLATLGAYYRQYQRLMQHWKATLEIPVLEVSYEALVADQEKVTRQLLEFCGLPWDEQCLKFYDSRRMVGTPSYDQVREPIYRKSVQRWKHYERFLEPLKKALSA